MVLTMVREIWIQLRKVRVELDTAYGSEYTVVMVGQYFSGTLQAHRVMDKFLCARSQLYLEVDPHITLYLFEHRAQRVGVEVIIQNVYT